MSTVFVINKNFFLKIIFTVAFFGKKCYTECTMSLFSLEQYRGKRVCVALSGGADSVCLLHHFFCGAQENAITLTALTCEHGIRGAQSLADLRFAEELCARWNVPLFIFRRDVPSFAAQHKIGLEEAGRMFRRECFDAVLKEGKADLIATAHHRDDYAETVLFRLARGTSLAGMKVFSEQYARPLLNVGRAEIRTYLAEHGLKYTEDASNEDTAYTRNALRHTVLPRLEACVAGAKRNLVAFARLAAKDDDYLQSLAAAALRGEEVLRLVADLPDPIFYRAAVLALKRMGAECDYTQALLGEIAALRALQSGKKICLPNGIMAIREQDEIVFYRPRQIPNGEIPFACGTFLFGDYAVTAGEGVCEEGLRFDWDAVPCGSVIRARREGDVITPFSGQKKTLKKYLTDKKIPARIGRGLPLLAYENEILAVIGLEISDAVKLTEKTVRHGYLVCRDHTIEPL